VAVVLFVISATVQMKQNAKWRLLLLLLQPKVKIAVVICYCYNTTNSSCVIFYSYNSANDILLFVISTTVQMAVVILQTVLQSNVRHRHHGGDPPQYDDHGCRASQ